MRVALERCRKYLVAAGAFSGLSNLLYLAPSLFMLQVYDRVIPSAGVATLVSLGLVTLAALAALVVFEWLRARILIRASLRLESELGERAVAMSISRPDLSRIERGAIMRDMASLREAMASPALVAALDAPWTLIYVAAAFLLHPALGVMAIVSAFALLCLAWFNERHTAAAAQTAREAAAMVQARHAQLTHHAAEVRALGMSRALAAIQTGERRRVDAMQVRTAFSASAHLSVIKFLRLALQSGVLALGALLVIEQALSAGAMIAASLLMARALAPIEQAVGAWKSIVQARDAYRRLNRVAGAPDRRAPIELPVPSGSVQVEDLSVIAPNDGRVLLDKASFAISPGEIVAIIGPSGAGKSTLLRAMAGALSPASGHVRFDQASRADCDPEWLARHVGYLPQDSILFPGSIRDNIARFRPAAEGDSGATDAEVIAAARLVDAHDMIVRLPQGYDTEIGPGNTGLSAGQAQRIALARALFGNPSILLLDEPTSALDVQAQQAFVALLGTLRMNGTTVLYSSHSADMLACADKLLAMADTRVLRLAHQSEFRRPPPRGGAPKGNMRSFIVR